MASTADYRSFSAKRERHTDVHTGTNSSELHYVYMNSKVGSGRFLEKSEGRNLRLGEFY